MASMEMERLKQILPKISTRLADRKEPMERLISKMKELQIFKDNEDIFQTLVESNNFKMLKYLKDILRIEGYETIVQYIEGKSAQAGDYTDNSPSSADYGSDFVCSDLESKSDPFARNLQEMMKQIQEIRKDMAQGFQDVQDKLEEAEERGKKLSELISKLEKDKDVLEADLKDISQTGVDETRLEVLQRKFDDLETKYNQLLNQMEAEKKKMGGKEMDLKKRNQQLQKEIAKLKIALAGMQVSKAAKREINAKSSVPPIRKKGMDDKTKKKN